MASPCFNCGNEDHYARDCPQQVTASTVKTGERPWCGTCDERTRQLDQGDVVRRCPRCHPLRGQLQAQFVRCGQCQIVIYNWDQMPCDKHTAVGVHRPYVGHPAAAPRNEGALRVKAAQQVAESRAARDGGIPFAHQSLPAGSDHLPPGPPS